MAFGSNPAVKIPSTVTFNPTPQGEAAARAGRASMGACSWLKWASIILGAVSLIFAVWLAVAKGGDLLDVVLLLGFAIGATLGTIALPIASIHLEVARPVEARVARFAWLFLLLIASIGTLIFVLQPAGSWTVTIGNHSPDRSRALASALALSSNALSGWFGRLWLLAAIESYRLLEGLRAPVQAEPEKEVDDPAALTPERVFRMWAGNHLELSADSTVASRDCLISYRQMCIGQVNTTPVGDAMFYQWLANEAAANPEQVFPIKSSRSHYRGWALVGANQRQGEIAPIPERPAA